MLALPQCGLLEGKGQPEHMCPREAPFHAMRHALARTARSWFRVVHYSVQQDHLHLLVEADDKRSLSRGLMGLAIRLARAANRAVGRMGKVWDDRFHARALTSPRETRSAIVYVLMNAKKHLLDAPANRRPESARMSSLQTVRRRGCSA